MTLKRMRASVAAACALALGGTTGAWAGGVRNVVELFTSQGCSSCPPADRVLNDLARDPSTLALSFPVDYWDYIGWKDTLADPGYTARQKAYAMAMGKDQVYTPQAIVNGLGDSVGSDRASIQAEEIATGHRIGVLSTPLNVTQDGERIDVSVGAAPAGAPQSGGVYLLAIASSRTVEINRGENAGSKVTYTNVVRAVSKLGEWNGTPVRFVADLARAHADGADSYAVIVQAGGLAAPSTILAAAKGP